MVMAVRYAETMTTSSSCFCSNFALAGLTELDDEYDCRDMVRDGGEEKKRNKQEDDASVEVGVSWL